MQSLQTLSEKERARQLALNAVALIHMARGNEHTLQSDEFNYMDFAMYAAKKSLRNLPDASDVELIGTIVTAAVRLHQTTGSGTVTPSVWLGSYNGVVEALHDLNVKSNTHPSSE